MPFTYSAAFWRQRARDANALAVQMRAADARAALLKTAWSYELIHLRTAHHEAKVAFNRAKLRLLSEGLRLSPVDKQTLAAKIDAKRGMVEDTRQAMEQHRKTMAGVGSRSGNDRSGNNQSGNDRSVA